MANMAAEAHAIADKVSSLKIRDKRAIGATTASRDAAAKPSHRAYRKSASLFVD